DMLAADPHAQRLGLEAEAVAGRARDVGEILRDLLARPVALGLAPAPLQVRDHPLERLARLVGTKSVVIRETDPIIARAVKARALCLLGKVLPLGVEGKLEVLRQRLERLRVVGRGGFRPWRDRALAQRRILVRNAQVGVDLLFAPEPAAGRAGAERIVE